MFPVVRIGSSKLMPMELSTRRQHSRVDMWRHRGGMSCACPGRLEMSRGSAEAKTRDIVVTLEFCGPSELMSPDVDSPDSMQLFSHHFIGAKLPK